MNSSGLRNRRSCPLIRGGGGEKPLRWPLLPLAAVLALALLAVFVAAPPAQAQVAPSQPPNVSAATTSPHTSAIKITWQTPTGDVVRFWVRIREQGVATWGSPQELTNTLTREYTFTSLSPGTTYEVGVVACGSTLTPGTSGDLCSTWVTATATTQASATITRVGVSAGNVLDEAEVKNNGIEVSVDLTGTALTCSGFNGCNTHLEVVTNPATAGLSIGVSNVESVSGLLGVQIVASASDFNPTQNFTVALKLKASGHSGTTDITSNALSVTAINPPDSPTNLRFTNTGSHNSVTFLWDEPDTSGGKAVTGYDYRFRVTDPGQGAGDNWTFRNTAGTSVNVTNLMPATEYDFSVRAKNALNTSFYATAVTHTTADDPNASAPGRVTDLSVSLSGDNATLTWTVPSNGGAAISSYRIEHDLTGSGTWAEANTTTLNAHVAISRTVTNAGYTSLTKFRIRHTNSAGDGPWSNVVMAGPGAPTDLTATTPDDTTDRLTWTAPTNTGGNAITDYEYRSRRVGTATWTTIATGSTGVSYDVTKPSGEEGSAYRYQVRAKTSAGVGPWSNVVTVAGKPGSPTNFTAAQVSGSVAIDLNWNAPNGTGGVAGLTYLVQWRVSKSGSFTGSDTLTSKSVTGTSVQLTQVDGLAPGTDYDFRIRAHNADRHSDFTGNDGMVGQMTVTIGASVTGTNPSPLTEGTLDGAQLTVDLVGTTYVSSLIPAHFFLETPPTGLTVSSVSRESNTRVVLTMAYSGDGFATSTSFRIRLVTTATTSNQLLTTPAVTVMAETAPGQVLSANASGGAGEVTVTWASVIDADGYKVQWKSGSEDYDASRQLVVDDGNAQRAVIGGLAPSTTYTVRVIATKLLAPDGTPSLDRTATTDAISASISSPSSLTERGLNGAQLTVDLVGTQYVSSLDASDFGFRPLGALRDLSVASVSRRSNTRAVLTLSFTGNISTDVGLQVVVDGSAHTSSGSLTTAAVTVTQAPKPAKVAGVNAVGGPSSLTVTWNTVNHADGYFVQWKQSSASSYAAGDSLDVRGGSIGRASVSGLLGETAYSVRVRAASDFASDGYFSNPVTATTLPGHAKISATNPDPLTERNLDGATLTVDLLPDVYDPWAPRLDRATVTVSGVPGVTVADVTRVSDQRMLVTLAYDDTDFDADATLRVQFYLAHTSIQTITAVTKDEDKVKAVVETAPGRVRNVRVVAEPQRINVTWDPVEGATGYRVEWSPAASYGSFFHKEWPWPTRYSMGGLQPGTEYTVNVVATKTRAPDGQRSIGASATTPAFGAMLTSTEPSPLTEDNLNRARLTVDLMGIEWVRQVEGRYYRFQLGRVNDCSQAAYYDNCQDFIVNRSVAVAGVERVSGSRAVVSLRARNVDLEGNGLWLRFPDDMHTHYYGEEDFIVLEVIAPDETGLNMRASVTVAAANPVSVNEGGSAATYTVVLDGQPSGNVVITPSSSNGDVTTQPASLTFTVDNWDTAQTVTVRASRDDDAADDTATISHTVSGADEYAGITVASVSVSVSDDDEAGVTVHPTELSVNEGGSASYTVVLDTQPVGDVSILVVASTGISAQPTELTFTSANWRNAQTVTVSAAQDDDTDDGTAWIIHSSGAGPDSGYDSVPVGNVIVDIIDDDENTALPAQQEPEPEPGSVTVSAANLPIREGGAATYTVVLDVEPTENVVITVSSNNGDVTTQPSSLTFTTGNWQTAQTVSVSAGQDGDKADDTATLSHSASGGNYDGVSVASVAVSVTDDDSDRAVLEAFYQATGGHSWTNIGNWLSDKPLNQWHGVTANGSGQVTQLVLRNNGLSGSLPAALGKMEHLQVLSLDRNSISGSLPSELGNLSNLTRLAMNRNSLSGAIPSQLGNLSNLSIIGLARNQLSGSLPTSLGNLSGLTKVSLHDNTGLSGALPSGFTNLGNLQRLAIANTGLCLPDNQAFDDWLAGVPDKPGIDGLSDCASP